MAYSIFVTPRTLGFRFLGFGAKGLGPGLDNIQFKSAYAQLCTTVNLSHLKLFTAMIKHGPRPSKGINRERFSFEMNRLDR